MQSATPDLADAYPGMEARPTFAAASRASSARGSPSDCWNKRGDWEQATPSCCVPIRRCEPRPRERVGVCRGHRDEMEQQIRKNEAA